RTGGCPLPDLPAGQQKIFDSLLTLPVRQLLHWIQKEGSEMEYSIHELSRLSGVSTRTLRWYDEIGLLKPGRVAESGYRYYGPAQVDRLQDILFYRALGVELARIRECQIGRASRRGGGGCSGAGGRA